MSHCVFLPSNWGKTLGVIPPLRFAVDTRRKNAKTLHFFLEIQPDAFDLSENAAFCVLRVSTANLKGGITPSVLPQLLGKNTQ